MSDKDIYAMMREPSNAEHGLVLSYLYNRYNHGPSIWKTGYVLILCIVLFVIVVRIFFPDKWSSSADDGMYVGFFVFSFLFCIIMHNLFSGCKQCARKILKREYRIIDCVAYEHKWLDYFSGEYITADTNVKLLINGNKVDRWYDISTVTFKNIDKNPQLPLLLFSTGKEWYVIARDGEYNVKQRNPRKNAKTK